MKPKYRKNWQEFEIIKSTVPKTSTTMVALMIWNSTSSKILWIFLSLAPLSMSFLVFLLDFHRQSFHSYSLQCFLLRLFVVVQHLYFLHLHSVHWFLKSRWNLFHFAKFHRMYPVSRSLPTKKKTFHSMFTIVMKIRLITPFNTKIQSASLMKCNWCVTKIRVACWRANIPFEPMHWLNMCDWTWVSTALSGSSIK